MSALKQMLNRHHEEILELRKTCPHESLKMSQDRSGIGCGSCWPSIDIVCKNCGVMKIIFFRDEDEYKNRANILKTLEIQKGFKDQRITTIQYEHQL
jgi:hypothetical protein